MADKVGWIEHFDISKENLERWRQDAGPAEHFLRWCLLHGKINEAEYLEWACLNYELPVIEAQFFSLPADTEFWDRVGKQEKWTPAMFPVHEWQGILYVACVEPDPKMKFKKPHLFVLASARALSLLWMSLNQNLDITDMIEERTRTQTQPLGDALALSLLSRQGRSTTAVLPATEKINQSAIVEGRLTETAPLETLMQEMKHPPATEENKAEPEIEMPSGFITQEIKGSLVSRVADPSSLATEEKSAAAASITAGLDDAPAGLNLTAADLNFNFDLPSESTATAAAGSQSAESMTLESQHSASPVADMSTNPTVTQKLAPAKPPTPPPPPQPVRTSTTTNAKTGVSSAPTTGSKTAPPAQPSMPPPLPQVLAMPPQQVATPNTGAEATAARKVREHTVTRSVNLDQLSQSTRASERQQTKTGSLSQRRVTMFEQCNTYEDVAEFAFSHMQDPYKKAVIMVFQSGQLRPWKWTDHVPFGGKNKPSAINLEKPSIFRIVFNTCLPFHGYVVANPTNDEFFREMNGGVTPGHVTIMPIMLNGQLAGMLMGMTDEKLSDGRSLLRKMETIADGVNRSLLRIRASRVA